MSSRRLMKTSKDRTLPPVWLQDLLRWLEAVITCLPVRNAPVPGSTWQTLGALFRTSRAWLDPSRVAPGIAITKMPRCRSSGDLLVDCSCDLLMQYCTWSEGTIDPDAWRALWPRDAMVQVN